LLVVIYNYTNDARTHERQEQMSVSSDNSPVAFMCEGTLWVYVIYV